MTAPDGGRDGVPGPGCCLLPRELAGKDRKLEATWRLNATPTGLSIRFGPPPWAVLTAVAVLRPPRRIPPPEGLDVTGASYWAVVAILFFEWEAAAFRDGSQWWHPTLSIATGPLLHHHGVKSAAFAVWLLAGWGLIRR